MPQFLFGNKQNKNEAPSEYGEKTRMIRAKLPATLKILNQQTSKNQDIV